MVVPPTTEARLEVGRHVDQLPSKEELEELIERALAEDLASFPPDMLGLPPDSPFMRRWFPAGVKKVEI